MDTIRIAQLLEPFVGSADDQRLTTNDLLNISTYLDLLLRWNARMNLTAIRQPEEIVTRHFGESLFAARHLYPCRRERPGSSTSAETLIDLGSGAGFPGLPIKIWAPHIHLTLIESNQKKATFLREITRALTLININVFAGRAQDYPNPPADVVTLRAVERFDTTLPLAARLAAPTGRLALLIGEAQLARTNDLTPGFTWSTPVKVPLSSSRTLVIGTPSGDSLRIGDPPA
jgi:16S rRNA (guanine527-N7)-methyltransferase